MHISTQRHLLLVALCLSLALPAVMFAQTPQSTCIVRGVAADSASRLALSYATIAVTDKHNNPVATSYSSETGAFKLDIQRHGHFLLVISSTGYHPATMPLVIDAARTGVRLDTLFLAPASHHLGGVTVSATRRQLVEQKPGMLVYNAEHDISNKGGTAADVLRKAPALNVDPQGNVTMRGNGTLKILINGRYSGQVARSPADALNMMPADMIKSVEIITSPSAKYDAEGAAGVINIITKKGSRNLNASIEATASNWEQAFNPRLSLSREKWQMSFQGHLHRLRSKYETRMERTSLENGTPATKLVQETVQDNVKPHGSAELTLGYLPDSVSEFSLNINAWLGNWPDNNRQNTRIFLANGTLADFYEQSVSTKEQFRGADFSLGYNRKLKRNGQELSLLAQYSPSSENTSYFTNQQETDAKVRYREQNKGITRNNEWTFQADFSQPIDAGGSYTLQTGLKSIFRDAGNRYQVWASEIHPPAALELQDSRSDHFLYSQNVLAGYFLLKMKLSRKWYSEIGGRLEHTSMDGRFTKMDNSFGSNFWNMIPTLTLTRKLNEEQQLSVSYTKRLTRPYIWDMNPNANASDPRNITVGNPLLEPEKMHQGELSYGWTTASGIFINATFFFKHTANTMIDFTTTDADGNATTMKRNLAGNQQYGLNFSSSFKLNPRWNVNNNININHLNYESSALFIVNKGWAGDINVNTMYKLPAKISLQAFGEYNTRIVTLQGYKTPRFYYSLSAKKELTANKMTITLAALNPFNRTIGQREIMNAASFLSGMKRNYYGQALKLTFNWEFGNRLDQGKKKRKISNDDVRDQQKG